ncbi:MAG TPA: class I SAM-dependent methyltransferase [Bryobacteraceae bacterium]|jgi:ubiquinone/menaquinone biosynthesis C-methylase UbiE
MGISMKSVSRRMSSDWNRRARSAPLYYVALGNPEQSWQDFVSGGQDLVSAFEKELGRLPSPGNRERWRALEIGCGPGRLMLPLSRHFGEIHGVDVSDEMVRLARVNLASVPHAHVHAADGTRLPQFNDEFFDFVYSYAVFQHIPSRDVVLNYLEETRRVLKTGGVARMQFNGLADEPGKRDTWSGVRFTAGEIADFARTHDLQLLALEGVKTQYMWATFLKRSAGWFNSIEKAEGEAAPATIRRVANADGAATIVPAHGPYASFALWAEGLPSSADLNTLRICIGDGEARLTYVGPRQPDGVQQVSGMLPQGLSASIQPVRLVWAEAPLGREGFLRLVPPGPEVPRIVSVTDGMYVASGRTISTQTIRVSLDAARSPEDLRVTLDGKPAQRISQVCTIPDIPRFEICFQLPSGGSAGSRQLEFRLGSRNLGAFEIVVAPKRFWWRNRLHSSRVYQALQSFVRARR